MSVLAQLVIGPEQHGVVRAALSTSVGPVMRTSANDTVVIGDVTAAHVHYTDALFGGSCESAADAFCRLAASLSVPLVVTLHDLPQPADTADRYRRRADAYAAVVGAADAVVVSSEYERRLLGAACDGEPTELLVVPLPLDAVEPPAAPLPVSDEVGVLGWIYPGKGHAEVAAALPPGKRLVALGDVSPGHDDLLSSLLARYPDRLSRSGFLDDETMRTRMGEIAVPVAWHVNVSASASIGSWLEAGRRPLVRDGAWARELADRCPGSVTIVADGDLQSAVSRAFAGPATTWLGDTRIGPGRREVTERLREFCLSVARSSS